MAEHFHNNFDRSGSSRGWSLNAPTPGGGRFTRVPADEAKRFIDALSDAALKKRDSG